MTEIIPEEGKDPGFKLVFIRELTEEFFKLGAKVFQKKYPHPFLVSSEKLPQFRDFISHHTMDVVGGDSARLAQAGPGLTGGHEDAPQERVAYAVLKSDRNVYSSKITIGRARNNDIVIRSPEISKLHAALVVVAKDAWQIVDMGSTNGTKLNGDKLPANRPVSVENGDVISLGRISFEFSTPDGFSQMMARATSK